jgi:hypothetical protein
MMAVTNSNEQKIFMRAAGHQTSLRHVLVGANSSHSFSHLSDRGKASGNGSQTDRLEFILPKCQRAGFQMPSEGTKPSSGSRLGGLRERPPPQLAPPCTRPNTTADSRRRPICRAWRRTARPRVRGTSQNCCCAESSNQTITKITDAWESYLRIAQATRSVYFTNCANPWTELPQPLQPWQDRQQNPFMKGSLHLPQLA